jgi:hypothetical protein
MADPPFLPVTAENARDRVRRMKQGREPCDLCKGYVKHWYALTFSYGDVRICETCAEAISEKFRDGEAEGY